MLVGVIMFAVACGCGALSHEQLLFQMNKRCYQGTEELVKADRKIRAYGAAHRHGLVLHAQDEFAEVSARFVRGLETLEPPAEDRDAFELYLRGAKQQAILHKREARFVSASRAPGKTRRAVRRRA